MHSQGKTLSPSLPFHLPADALHRAEQFLRAGDLSALMKLPLRPHERIEAAEVLLHASGTYARSPSDGPLPTLSEALYARLHAIAATAQGEQVGAALFILANDFQARACNLALQASHDHASPSRPSTSLS